MNKILVALSSFIGAGVRGGIAKISQVPLVGWYYATSVALGVTGVTLGAVHLSKSNNYLGEGKKAYLLDEGDNTLNQEFADLKKSIDETNQLAKSIRDQNIGTKVYPLIESVKQEIKQYGTNLEEFENKLHENLSSLSQTIQFIIENAKNQNLQIEKTQKQLKDHITNSEKEFKSFVSSIEAGFKEENKALVSFGSSLDKLEDFIKTQLELIEEVREIENKELEKKLIGLVNKPETTTHNNAFQFSYPSAEIKKPFVVQNNYLEFSKATHGRADISEIAKYQSNILETSENSGQLKINRNVNDLGCRVVDTTPSETICLKTHGK